MPGTSVPPGRPSLLRSAGGFQGSVRSMAGTRFTALLLAGAKNGGHEQFWVGIPLGVLIGVVTGVIFVSFMRLLGAGRSARTVLPITTRALSLPIFWVSGNFLTGVLLQGQLDQIRSSYLTSLAISFVIVVAYPVGAYVVRVGSEFGK